MSHSLRLFEDVKEGSSFSDELCGFYRYRYRSNHSVFHTQKIMKFISSLAFFTGALLATCFAAPVPKKDYVEDKQGTKLVAIDDTEAEGSSPAFSDTTTGLSGTDDFLNLGREADANELREAATLSQTTSRKEHMEDKQGARLEKDLLEVLAALEETVQLLGRQIYEAKGKLNRVALLALIAENEYRMAHYIVWADGLTLTDRENAADAYDAAEIAYDKAKSDLVAAQKAYDGLPDLANELRVAQKEYDDLADELKAATEAQPHQ